MVIVDNILGNGTFSEERLNDIIINIEIIDHRDFGYNTRFKYCSIFVRKENMKILEMGIRFHDQLQLNCIIV